MDRTKDSCCIDGIEYSLSDVEKMGLKNFQVSAHIHPYHSIFRYYPNTKKYVKEEKKYRNFSLEALKNNTIYLQDAKNFDDCFDCAVDLEWDKFLFERVKTYCTYFLFNFREILLIFLILIYLFFLLIFCHFLKFKF